MFFGITSNNIRPPTPVPSFILTDTSSTIENSDAVSTPLTKSLDERLSHLQETVGESHPDVVHALSALGDACLTNEDHEEALRYYTQALEVGKKTFPVGHPSVADTLCSIGNVSMALSMYQESKSSYQAALDFYRAAFSNRSWATGIDGPPMQQVDYNIQHKFASTLASMGSLEFEQKNYAAAMKYFEDALLDSKRAAVTAVALDRAYPVKGKSTLKQARMFVSEMFNNLASVSAEQGDKANAIKNYNSALALQMQELGEDHPSVAVTLHNIGTMHYRSQEFHYALKSYKQVLKMRRYLLGNEHISIAECLLNIATVHEKAGEFERCQSALNAAIRITAKHHGAQSVQCAHITQLIGALNARSECDEVALEYYDKALELYGEVGLDDDHASVQSVHNGIAYIKNKNQDDTSVLDLINNMFNDSCGGLWYTEDTKTSVWNGSGVTSNGVASEHGASNASAVMV
jgi:tetratricopeptide (TPR) repeat protein